MGTQGEGPNEATDNELVLRVRNGEAGAFDTLFERYYPRVFHFALRLDGNRSNAEDVAQAAFVKAYQSINGLRDGQAFLEWVYRIALNQVRDRAKQARRKPWMSFLDLRRSEDTGEASREPVEFADSTYDPASVLTRKEMGVALKAAIAELPLEFREVLVLHHYQEMGLKEISSLLGVPDGTVKSRLGRARQRLRDAMAEWVTDGEAES